MYTDRPTYLHTGMCGQLCARASTCARHVVMYACAHTARMHTPIQQWEQWGWVSRLPLSPIG
eukprot:676458-Pyramimonas_sp.AAC.1